MVNALLALLAALPIVDGGGYEIFTGVTNPISGGEEKRKKVLLEV